MDRRVKSTEEKENSGWKGRKGKGRREREGERNKGESSKGIIVKRRSEGKRVQGEDKISDVREG